MAMLAAASIMALTSCEEKENGGTDTPQPQEEVAEFSYSLSGTDCWEAQSVLAGYEISYGDTLVGIIASANKFNNLMDYANSLDEMGYPHNVLLIEMAGKEGTMTQNGEPEDLMNDVYLMAVLVGEGYTTVNFFGESEDLPNAWMSENITVTVTKFDLANNKISATITASMKDYTLSDDEYETAETKTLTVSIKNYPLDNWTGRLYKSMKKLKTK
jgi:hypothetical protein